MKRFLYISFCFCTLCALSATALAAADSAPPRWAFATEEEWKDAVSAWEVEQAEPEPPPETSEPIESEGENNAALSPPPVDTDPDQKYPVGSYVDAAGHVWSPSGQPLSPDAAAPSEPEAEDTLPPDSQGNPNSSEVPALDSDTLTVIAGLVSDIATDPPTWYVEDLRPEDTPVELLDGLKALVTSLFLASIPRSPPPV